MMIIWYDSSRKVIGSHRNVKTHSALPSLCWTTSSTRMSRVQEGAQKGWLGGVFDCAY